MNPPFQSITIVRHAMNGHHTAGRKIVVHADRWQLAKMRWRAQAEDGREFGFDLEHPLKNGDIVATNDYGYYVIEQSPEPVLVIPVNDTAHSNAIAWSVGNLHQPLQVAEKELIAPDDPAIRQLCDQQHIHFFAESRIFEPFRAVSGHHHHH